LSSCNWRQGITNPTYVAYLRVSTEGQGKSGLGLEAQHDAIARFVSADAKMLEHFVEVESGKKSDRPELTKALVCAKQNNATLLIAKLDRLARNVAFIANLLESGGEVVAVDMPQANKFMLHVMAAVAEQEALVISERTKAALAAAKARGVKLGWSNESRVDEQRIASAKGVSANIQKAEAFANGMLPVFADLHAKGISRPSHVARALNNANVPTARGGRWHSSNVKNLQLRQRNHLLQ